MYIMKKLTPFYYNEWLGNKPNFPYNVNLHTIEDSYQSHRHSFLEFFYVFEGTGTQVINGKSHPLNPGTFSVILPYQFHEFHADKESPIKLFNCSMKFETIFGSGATSDELKNLLFLNEFELSPYVTYEDKTAQKLFDIFIEMRNEFENTGLWSNLILTAKVYELLVLFDRKRRLHLNPNLLAGSKKENKIWDVLYYIHQNYMNDLSLVGLSKTFYLNSSYLSTALNKYMGKNFKSFLNEIRIIHACRLLCSTDLSVTDIAYEVGFKSYSSFCRVFVSLKKMSALDFRKHSL